MDRLTYKFGLFIGTVLTSGPLLEYSCYLYENNSIFYIPIAMLSFAIILFFMIEVID